MDAWAFLNFLSLIALTIAFAFSCGMPCVSLSSRRTVSFAAGVTAPGSRFFAGAPRFPDLPCRPSNYASSFKYSVAHKVRLLSVRSNSGVEGQEPMSLEEICSLLGITRERVRQIKEKALARLRHVSRARALESFLF